MNNDSSKLPPPYASFGVFLTTISTLAKATVPSGPLDRRVLDGLSGADYGSLISAMRFLGFVDEDRKATATYRELVQVSDDRAKFQEFLLETLRSKYKPITGDVDIESGTISELEKAFKEYGVAAGQMLTKTIRFFVKALAECGITVSPHITKAKPKAPRVSSSTKSYGVKNPPRKNDPEGGAMDSPPKEFERMPIPGVASAYIQYPADLTEAHCQLFEAMIGALRVYVKSRTGGIKEKKP